MKDAGVDMIEIRSYLGTPDSRFTPVEDATAPPADLEYIAGAIELTIDGKVILDRQLWDSVNFLWAAIADLMESFSQHGQSATYFPDQPILLSLRRVRQDDVIISVEATNIERRAAMASIRDLFEGLPTHGELFFEELFRLVPEDRSNGARVIEHFRALAEWARTQ